MTPRTCRARPTSLPAVACAFVAGSAFTLAPATARAQARDAAPAAAAAGDAPLATVNNPFVQYGVAFTTEFVATSSALCNNNPQVVPTCILGSGAGLVFPRIGWRSSGHWYIGGAYEFSKQGAGTVYVLPILQQLRGEARYYFLEGHLGTPFVEGSAGYHCPRYFSIVQSISSSHYGDSIGS